MNYAIINGLEFIENVKNKQGERQEDLKIIKGHKITRLNKCYEMLEKTLAASDIDIASMNSWSNYLKKKDVPFAITESKHGSAIHYRLFVHGVEIVRKKSESKKLSGRV